MSKQIELNIKNIKKWSLKWLNSKYGQWDWYVSNLKGSSRDMEYFLFRSPHLNYDSVIQIKITGKIKKTSFIDGYLSALPRPIASFNKNKV